MFITTNTPLVFIYWAGYKVSHGKMFSSESAMTYTALNLTIS